jgi:uncharacterized RDD family membrane protein YckC
VTEAAFETASWLRRILALFVDWTACTLVVVLFVGTDRYTEPGAPEQYYTLLIYVLESAVLTWAAGGSFGKLVTGLRVVPVDGRVRPLIPPLVFKSDGRGLHDLFAGTASVTAPTFRALVAGR